MPLQTKNFGFNSFIQLAEAGEPMGFVPTTSPEQTMLQLQQKLPQKWIDINRLLMPKHICTGRLLHCSNCLMLEYCKQIGVTSHR